MLDYDTLLTAHTDTHDRAEDHRDPCCFTGDCEGCNPDNSTPTSRALEAFFGDLLDAIDSGIATADTVKSS